jgi:heptosyltransferase-2
LLIRDFTDDNPARPRLYPSPADFDKVRSYKDQPYITISPASVWFTKQYPPEKWAAFIRQLPGGYTVYLLGAPSDKQLCEQIRTLAAAGNTAATAGKTAAFAAGKTAAFTAGDNHRPGDTPAALAPINLSGQLSFLQSAALMKEAGMNYVNDSAPLHFASAVNAPVTAVYCSTIPAFGFGPLSDKKFIVEIKQPLDCRPCGLHGYRACPLGHFNCAYKIEEAQLLANLPHII